MKKIIHVVGARPNFIKMSPVFNAVKNLKIHQIIVHTGQHYSENMSDIFFKELGIKKPDVNLNIGSGSHAKQTAEIMLKFEEVVLQKKPDLVIVYGDINSTLAAALVCSKMNIKIAHIEAGLRSNDKEMPEEINRIITDQISNFHFTPSQDADLNLLNEGINKKQIFFVGNVMIDTLTSFLNLIKNREIIDIPFRNFGIVTIHRPSNVDNPKQLKKMILELNKLSKITPLVFPIHPRTKKKLEEIKEIRLDNKNIFIIEPLGYLDFLNLVYYSKFVLTDSGGIQEETSFLGIPCFTLRKNTERPITITEGTNVMIGDNFKLLEKQIILLKAENKRKKTKIKGWDGKASIRIAKIIKKIIK